MVIVNFIRDTEVGMFARAKRLAKSPNGTSNGAALRMSPEKEMKEEAEGLEMDKCE